jgi:hypothetical protein
MSLFCVRFVSHGCRAQVIWYGCRVQKVTDKHILIIRTPMKLKLTAGEKWLWHHKKLGLTFNVVTSPVGHCFCVTFGAH